MLHLLKGPAKGHITGRTERKKSRQQEGFEATTYQCLDWRARVLTNVLQPLPINELDKIPNLAGFAIHPSSQHRNIADQPRQGGYRYRAISTRPEVRLPPNFSSTFWPTFWLRGSGPPWGGFRPRQRGDHRKWSGKHRSRRRRISWRSYRLPGSHHRRRSQPKQTLKPPDLPAGRGTQPKQFWNLCNHFVSTAESDGCNDAEHNSTTFLLLKYWLFSQLIPKLRSYICNRRRCWDFPTALCRSQ